VGEMVKNYQKVLFRKNNKSLDLNLKESTLTFAKISEEEEKVVKEIAELEKKYNPQVLQEQTGLENKVAITVEKLKDDLRTPNAGGRKILDLIKKSNEDCAKVIYTPNTPKTIDYYGSLIKTSYNNCSRPYTHPLYLSNDLPGQI